MSTPKENALTKPLNVFLLAAISCLLWGSAAPVIKTGYQMLNILPCETWRIILFAGMRFTISGILIIVFMSLKRKKMLLPGKTSWGKVLAVAFFQTAGQYVCFYLGTAHASGVHCAILSGGSSILAILFACYLFRQEKMTWGKAVGCLLCFGGILVMNLSGIGGQVSFMGEGMVLLSGAFSAIAAGLVKVFTKKEDPVTLTGWQFFLGGLSMCGAALLNGARLTISSFSAFLILLYLGFLSAVAYSLWTTLIKNNPVSSVSIYGFMTPLFGLVLSAFILGEFSQAFNFQTLCALILVCTGIIAVNMLGTKKTQQT